MTMNGLTILSDPVFSKCSINDYLGPKRLRPIPCQLEDFIDTVDIVVVSHDHFDHLGTKDRQREMYRHTICILKSYSR